MSAVATRRRGARKDAWSEYAHATKVDHFQWWAGAHLVQSIGQFAGQPFALEPWQVPIFTEMLAVTADGAPYWQVVVVVIPRKNGKTTMYGGYATYHCDQEEGSPEVLLTASSDRQAGRLYDSVGSFVRQSPYLSERFHLRDYIGEIARTDGMGKILRMASDPNRAHGYNPSLVLPDELHAWLTPSLVKAWGAFTTAGGARVSSQICACSTAGDAQDRESSILGQLLDRNEAVGELEKPHEALTISRNHDARTIIFNYSAATFDRRDVKALKRANPASWITPAYLKQQSESPSLSDAQVLQLHGCVWSESATSWLPAETWNACAAPGRVVEDGARIVLGFDGSASNDSTALIGCTVDDEVPHLFVLGCWERPSTRHEWKVPRLEVDAVVREACDRYRVLEFAADPPLWRSELEVWEAEIPGVEFVHYDTRLLSIMGDACSRLYSAVVEGRMTHDGSGVLARHVANCKGKDTRWGMVVTKSRNSPHKIDAAVAAIAAHDRGVACQGSSGDYVIRLYDEPVPA